MLLVTIFDWLEIIHSCDPEYFNSLLVRLTSLSPGHSYWRDQYLLRKSNHSTEQGYFFEFHQIFFNITYSSVFDPLSFFAQTSFIQQNLLSVLSFRHVSIFRCYKTAIYLQQYFCSAATNNYVSKQSRVSLHNLLLQQALYRLI